MKPLFCIAITLTVSMLTAEAHANDNHCGRDQKDSGIDTVGYFMQVPKRQASANTGRVNSTREDATTDQAAPPMPPKVPTVEEITRRCPPQSSPPEDDLAPTTPIVRTVHPTPVVQPAAPKSPRTLDVKTTILALPAAATLPAQPPTAFEQLFGR